MKSAGTNAAQHLDMLGNTRVVTLRSEYLFNGVLCVGHRVRGAQEWTDQHPIVGLCVSGVFVPNGGYYYGVPPRVGTRMILGEDSLSSEVMAVEVEISGKGLGAFASAA